MAQWLVFCTHPSIQGSIPDKLLLCVSTLYMQAILFPTGLGGFL